MDSRKSLLSLRLRTNQMLHSPGSTSDENDDKSISIQMMAMSEIDTAIEKRWHELVAESQQFHSPYFQLEFVKAVDRVRNDVQVAIFSQKSAIYGILPFQRTRHSHAEPPGGRINDVHGVIGGIPANRTLIEQFLDSARLKSYSFHGLKAIDESLEGYRFKKVGSYFIDLKQGWNEYKNWVVKNSSTVRRHNQKRRALERDIGPLSFELDCRDPVILEKLIELKRSRYQRSKTFDILSVDWARNLLREIHSTRTKRFQGLLSVLMAGDQLVACHFGMMSGNQVHYWFPTYDLRFRKYSPGTELILNVAQQSADRGITKIDFGYGDDSYKFRFCNQSEELSCGRFQFNSIAWRVANKRYHIRNQLKKIPFKQHVKKVLRKVFPGFGHWNYK